MADWGFFAYSEAADDHARAVVRQAIAVGQADMAAGRFVEFSDPVAMASFLDELARRALA